MKKLLIVLICALLIMLTACDDKSATDAINTTVEEETTATNYVIDEISGIEGYSYIGAGAVTETESNTRSVHSHYEKKILGIRKSDGKAEPVKFKNKKGNEIPSSPSVTAELVTEKFNFYKLSYDSSDYYETDFVSAPGDLYCIESSNGAIYKLDGITGLYAERGNYDYYDGLFVGSFIFEDGTEYLCKVYMEGSEIKIDKKIDTKDFPEFKQVFMDRNKNIFAYEINNGYLYNDSTRDSLRYVRSLKYIYGTNGKYYKINVDVILGYNRVVYYNACVRHTADGNDYSRIMSLKKYLHYYVLDIDGNYKVFGPYLMDYYNIEDLSDGRVKYTIKEPDTTYEKWYGSSFIGTPCYDDIDLAYTEDFLPPELARSEYGPYLCWHHSDLIDVIGNKYIYLTSSHTDYYGDFYRLIAVTYSDDECMKYDVNNMMTDDVNELTVVIPLQWAYGNKKFYFFENDELKVVDVVKETKTTISNREIVKYHSIGTVNNNKIAFQGTNSSGDKLYYEIDPSDDSITLLETTTPTYSSVSFKPINQ